LPPKKKLNLNKLIKNFEENLKFEYEDNIDLKNETNVDLKNIRKFKLVESTLKKNDNFDIHKNRKNFKNIDDLPDKNKKIENLNEKIKQIRCKNIEKVRNNLQIINLVNKTDEEEEELVKKYRLNEIENTNDSQYIFDYYYFDDKIKEKTSTNLYVFINLGYQSSFQNLIQGFGLMTNTT
jgi:hypothetical protein